MNCHGYILKKPLKDMIATTRYIIVCTVVLMPLSCA